VRILVINPNSTESMTASIGESARRVASSGVEIVAVSGAGPASIESHVDEIESAAGVLQHIVDGGETFDAFVLACYGNHPAINAARELTRRPVVGIAEASMSLAGMLGHTFSIITTSPRWRPMLIDAVRVYGFSHRCASVRASGLTVLDIDALPESEVRALLMSEARQAIDDDGAEVIVLGCAGMTGLDAELSALLGAPVVDGVAAGVKLAEALVACRLETSRLGAFAEAQPRRTMMAAAS
jgi:allantoin racemase